jgi:hypothetical protein
VLIATIWFLEELAVPIQYNMRRLEVRAKLEIQKN